jgi:hypothetical protein
VLSPVIRIWLTPSLADCVRQLDTDLEASGPHDFAVREKDALVSSTIRVHRIPLRVRDDRERP